MPTPGLTKRCNVMRRERKRRNPAKWRTMEKWRWRTTQRPGSGGAWRASPAGPAAAS
jgi:hypothetical protein